MSSEVTTRAQMRKHYDHSTRIELLEHDMDESHHQLHGLRHDLREYADRQEAKFDRLGNRLVAFLAAIAVSSVTASLTALLTQ